jgi:acetyl-CoA carboxylase carboxyltransferase component
MGGARMHATVSGCGDNLASDDAEAVEMARWWFSYLPVSWRDQPPPVEPAEPGLTWDQVGVPTDPRQGYDAHRVIDALVDDGSFFELKPLFAPEIIVGLAHLGGNPIGVLANNPGVTGGVLFVDSADKAARFIWLCDSYNIPLLYLCDVPGFMIGTEVERQGIIRHGAKMITAVSQATVPRISVIVRKAYGAGLYAMCGPGFEPDACLALPTAQIAVMGPDAAVNAVYANRIAAITDPIEREQFIKEREAEYEADVDLLRLAADLVIDAIVQPEDLRDELLRRFTFAGDRARDPHRRSRTIIPG